MNDYWAHRATSVHEQYRAARDLLLRHRDDHDEACRQFRWPRPDTFNWALEWFDVMAADNDRPALTMLDADGTATTSFTFAQMSARSDALAVWLRARGVRRGDRTVVALEQRPELWDCLLALLKIGAVVIPLYTSITLDQCAERIRRGQVRHVICETSMTPLFDTVPGAGARVVADGPAFGTVPHGWRALPTDLTGPAGAPFVPDGPTAATDLAFGYFTSGSTAEPKLVGHTHASYPIGHLSSLYWNGLLPGDRHLNVSAVGWAKHSWSSFFVPWTAQAELLVPAVAVAPSQLPRLLERAGATTLCAPASAWSVISEHLDDGHPVLREATSAGEPADPRIVERVRYAWGVQVRDGYGQTETTCLAGTSPGMISRPGRLGRVMPGYQLLIDGPGRGELCVDLDPEPVGVTSGYLTGEPPRLDRERGLASHAVVGLREGWPSSETTVRALLEHAAAVLAEPLCPRSVEFVDALPRTMSGKVRRATMRTASPAPTAARSPIGHLDRKVSR
jgi:acetyl-CoA synthetase